MALNVADIAQGGRIQSRALIVQQKTGRPVQFEITDQARQSLENWIAEQGLRPPDLSQDEKHSSRPTTSGAYQTGEYIALPGYRCGSLGGLLD